MKPKHDRDPAVAPQFDGALWERTLDLHRRHVVLTLGVMTTQHYMMLQRNLLYTAVTRARELVVIVGSKQALGLAVKNDRITQRYTSLAERVGEMVAVV